MRRAVHVAMSSTTARSFALSVAPVATRSTIQSERPTCGATSAEPATFTISTWIPRLRKCSSATRGYLVATSRLPRWRYSSSERSSAARGAATTNRHAPKRRSTSSKTRAFDSMSTSLPTIPRSAAPRSTYVERGAADLGIVGKDVLMESKARVLELVDLRFGACRFVVAAPRAALERSLDEYRHLGSLEVATKYPRVAEEHFRKRGIQVEIVKVAGSAEVAPQVGLSDWIVDLVATGATLKANDLAVVEDIATCTARLIANPSAYHLRRREIAPLVDRLAQWAATR